MPWTGHQWCRVKRAILATIHLLLCLIPVLLLGCHHRDGVDHLRLLRHQDMEAKTAMISIKHPAMAGTAAGKQVTIITRTRAEVARISTLTQTKLKISTNTSVTTDNISKMDSKMEAGQSVTVIIKDKAMVNEVAITIRVMAGDSSQFTYLPLIAWDVYKRE